MSVARQVCPLCGIDDEVSLMPGDADDAWDFTCTGSTGHMEPFTWVVHVESGSDGALGIMSELGIDEDLPRCIHAGEPWVEYGIVEHRYKLLRPDVYFGELLPRYGHVAIAPTGYSTTTFLAHVLSRLRRRGTVAYQFSSRTGIWRTHGLNISYWALPPAPNVNQLYTWESFATDNQLDPMVWDLTDPRRS